MRTTLTSRMPENALVLMSAAVLCIVTGAGVSMRPQYVAAAVAFAAAGMLARWNRGVLAGGLALLVLNGVPFLNVQPSATGGNVLDDVSFVALLGVLAVCTVANWREASGDRLVIATVVWAAAYLLWFGWEATRAIGADESLVSTVTFGRDFMFFGFLLPLGLAGLRRREHVLGFALTLGVGAGLYAMGQILSVVLGLGLPWLVHVGKTASFDGVIRIYAPMNDLIIAAFPLSLGFVLLGPPGTRRWAVPLALVTGLANALSFTRAVYASETAALLLVGLIYAVRAGWEGTRIRRAALVGAGCVALATAIAGGAGSGQPGTPVQAVVARAELGLTDVQNDSGNVGYRLRQARYEVQALGGEWLTGRGLRTPASFWVQGERDGSLRNSDLGTFSVIITLGIIGLVLVYLPVIAGLVLTLRQRGPVAFGGAMYLGAAIIGSITLATLSSESGLLVVGSTLILCGNWPHSGLTRQTGVRPPPLWPS